MHNGYLMVEGEKMSKSLGNFYTVHELLDEFPGEAIRLVLLQTHYRQPLDFTRTAIAEARSPVRMARAMKHAVEAGRDAYLAGRMAKRKHADPSSPLAGLL